MKTLTSREGKAGVPEARRNGGRHDTRRHLSGATDPYQRYEELKRGFRDLGLSQVEYEKACRRAAKIAGL